MAALIEFLNASFQYYPQHAEPIQALSNINLSIQSGEFTAIIGANGSGKSTLGKLLNALLIPDSGVVKIQGMDTREHKNHAAIRTLVGMIFQRPEDQIVATTVEEDVAFGPGNLGLPSNEIRNRVACALSASGLTSYRSRPSYLLSAGEIQRLALAGVLAMHPTCIIFDETTAMLDPAGREMVMKQAKELHRKGTTILFITHLMEEAAQAERVIVLDKGKIVMDGSPRQVFNQNIEEIGLEKPIALTALNMLQPFIPSLSNGILTKDNLFNHIPYYEGNHRTLSLTPRQTILSQSIITANNLSYTYMLDTPLEHQALDDLSISIGSGNMHGLIGATGSGKSTLLQHFNGLLRAQSGTLSVLGLNMNNRKLDTRSLRRRVGLSFQQPENQIFKQYVGDEVAYAARQLGHSDTLANAVKSAMEAVGLNFSTYKDRLTTTLSGGELRKTALASALVTKPDILLLDEPLAGLDPLSRKEVMALFTNMHATGLTLVLSTHQFDGIIGEMDTVSVLQSGKDITHGTPADLFSTKESKLPSALKPPFTAELCAVLIEKGWPLPAGIVQLNEIIEMIAKITKRTRS
ncbi:MAG: ATP-binding cassette domain-containing protein [Anaerolineaceae bacterium]|nr:ATP-binding cassette domain-containing protein [Anaerolineaceae bacterium]